MKFLDYSILTDDQKELIGYVKDWYFHRNDQVFAYSGFPGTGKTFVIPYIIDALHLTFDDVAFVAYTGKAASNLCQKGLPAKTIHSVFYESVEVPRLDSNGQHVYMNGRLKTDLRFRERNTVQKFKLIIVDEWSMVNEDMFHAMTKHGIPLLCAGDSAQLKAIIGTSPIEKYVKYSLTEIMRQAKDSGIITLANILRTGEPLPHHYMNYYNEAYIMSSRFLTNKILRSADIILTSKNKTRNKYNDMMRDMYGFHGKLPHVGEKLICRKNAWNKVIDGMPLINGTTGTIIHPIDLSDCNLSRGIYKCDFRPDSSDYDYFESLACDYGFLNQPAGEKELDLYNVSAKLEYAYALTVHASQGSTYENVIYIDDSAGWDKDTLQKLRYTAITRASKKVYFICDDYDELN